MRTSVIYDELPRVEAPTQSVPCDEVLGPPPLAVEIRCETVSPSREEELLRLACAQRIERLRARLNAVGEVCRAALGARGASLC